MLINPDQGGNLPVGPVCVGGCSGNSPSVGPNPNGAYPGGASGAGGGNGAAKCNVGSGSAGSTPGGWPAPPCPTDCPCGGGGGTTTGGALGGPMSGGRVAR
jgi:hypothetical protein